MARGYPDELPNSSQPTKRLEELEHLRETGEIRNYSKKMQSQLTREYAKIYRNLNGMREMNRCRNVWLWLTQARKRMPSTKRDCWHQGFALIDTDSNPDQVDLPIPGNDDSLRSIRLIMQHLSDAIKQGRSLRPEEPKKADLADEPKAVPNVR